MRIYFNDYFEIHFVANGLQGKDHDISKQFNVVNRTLGTVEAQVASFAHAVSYCNMYAEDWKSLVKDTRGQFDPEIQTSGISFDEVDVG